MPNHLQEGKEVNLITFSIISSSSGRIETRKIQVPQRSTTWLGQIFTHYPSSNLFVYPANEKENSALLLSRRTYPPRDSWNLCGLPPPFGYAGTKSPLTTNQQTSSGWLLPVTPRRRFSSWASVSRSRGRFAPCPRIWVICSHTMLLQSDLAGERSQFATENKTASERTFVRFFSTKHGILRITVGRSLPKETPIRSAPRLGGIYLIPITRRGSL
uniref:Uncharacterized protein n=1 Tax=Lactuca sativa TaxID=4236 RepID=A0A9R1X8H2_LACSA|nr:hypothetical protein LSAT_V11C500235070 [Lactuca sativa]